MRFRHIRRLVGSGAAGMLPATATLPADTVPPTHVRDTSPGSSPVMFT
jgi:hypothetical protein